MIRDYANGVLIQINQPTLTDEEAVLLPSEYSESEIFKSLGKVMSLRGLTGTSYKKLRAVALLNGVEPSKEKKPSNILIGRVLE